MTKSLLITAVSILFMLFMGSYTFAFRCDVSATGISFGVYDIFSNTPNDGLGTISVSCKIPPQAPQSPLLVSIALSSGLSGNIAQRQMESANGDRLNYNLYTNPSFSSIWGDENSFALQSILISRDNPYTGTIYARMPARQNVSVGLYKDVIIATINW